MIESMDLHHQQIESTTVCRTTSAEHPGMIAISLRVKVPEEDVPLWYGLAAGSWLRLTEEDSEELEGKFQGMKQ